MSRSPRATPAWLRWVTRASLVLGLIALAITVHAVGVHALIAHLRAIGPWFLVVFAIEVGATCCDAGAVFLVARGPGGPRWRHVVVAQFAGRAVNSVTPGANLGEALKISLLARDCEPPRAAAAVMYTAIVNVIVSLSVIALGLLATVMLVPLPLAAELALVAISIGACGGALGLAVLLRRGMLAAVTRVAARLRVLSAARRARWREPLEDLDARLRGERQRGHRAGAFACVVTSQVLSRGLVWVMLFGAGYVVSGPELIAIVSAGVVLNWIANLVPLGLGIAEGGNGVLFAALGAPAALGVALALARRVNHVVFAAIGFAILGLDRLAVRIAPTANPVREVPHAVKSS